MSAVKCFLLLFLAGILHVVVPQSQRVVHGSSHSTVYDEWPRFEQTRELFHDDDFQEYQLGYRNLNPWVEKIFNKYASKTPEPGSDSLDFGRHKYEPEQQPYNTFQWSRALRSQ